MNDEDLKQFLETRSPDAAEENISFALTNLKRLFATEIDLARKAERFRLRAALRALAEPLAEAASGSLEGPDIEEILEKAGLIAWDIFDRENPEHKELSFDFEIGTGNRFWRLTDFGREVLGKE